MSYYTDDDRALVRAVREAAAEHPDYVYDKGTVGFCEYAPSDPAPMGCLMGYAFRQHMTRSIDDRSGGIDEIMGELEDEGLYAWTSEIESWATHAQVCQDQGQSWAQAVRSADELYPNVAQLAQEAAS